MSKERAIICDLDGTLADVEHRLHHIRQTKKDWKSFHGSMKDDKVNQWCHEVLRAMKEKGYRIVLLTGRDDAYLEDTKLWLHKHDIAYDELFMRKEKDFRPDEIVKREIYENQIKDKYDVLFILEDRLKVVEMWRSIGLLCLQCAWGDF